MIFEKIFFAYDQRYPLEISTATEVIDYADSEYAISFCREVILQNTSTVICVFMTGSNNWNASNVWIDSASRLHLKVSRSTTTGQWSSSEVFSDADLMYGTYKWRIQGRIDQLDPNIVLGLYSFGGPSGSNEIDIEVAAWGEKVPKPYNIHYTTYPGHLNGTKRIHKSKRFDLTGSQTTHWYTWTPSKVIFGSQHGFRDTLTAQRFFAYETPQKFAKDMPKTPIRVHMNLWLWGGNAPINGKEVEIIIKEFSFTQQ